MFYSQSTLLRLTILTLIFVSSSAFAYVRLSSSLNHPYYWANPGNITVVINDQGSDDIQDGSEFVAIRMAIDEWNTIPDTSMHITENTDPSQQARQDFQADDILLIMFDEDNSTGLFPPGVGVVAFAPFDFGSGGKLTDSDIIFNGKHFQFSTEGEANKYDVYHVAAHEIGHLVGLDHSGFNGATMFPYVTKKTKGYSYRNLSPDDTCGVRASYPQGNLGSISGRVRRANGQGVAGAHVTATNALGRAVASVLTSPNGNFTLPCFSAFADYSIAVSPFEGSVTINNLRPGKIIETNFAPTKLANSVPVAPGATSNIGDIVVGDDVPLVGKPFFLRVAKGETKNLSVALTPLAAGTILESSDPNISTVVTGSNGSLVNPSIKLDVTVPEWLTGSGYVSLTATHPSGEQSFMPGAIAVVPPDPMVLDVQPPSGSTQGGETVTIYGENFRAGARVVLGDNFYNVRVVGPEAKIVSTNEIQLVTKPTSQGIHDVVVIDATGVEGQRGSYLVSDTATLLGEATVCSSGTPKLDIIHEPANASITVRLEDAPKLTTAFLGVGPSFDSAGKLIYGAKIYVEENNGALPTLTYPIGVNVLGKAEATFPFAGANATVFVQAVFFDKETQQLCATHAAQAAF